MSPDPGPPPVPLALADGTPLEDFLAQVPELALPDRYVLVEQALALLEGYYVHLDLKKAMHAVNPVQRLRLLEARMAALTTREFHAELTATFGSLRDLHTQYLLPRPWTGHVATLGLLVERCWDTPDAGPRYVVSKLHPTLAVGTFGEGAQVLLWNGTPVHVAVERLAERSGGSNPHAAQARAVERLTLRDLRTSPPPDERHVTVTYRPDGTDDVEHEVRLGWRVLAHEPGTAAADVVDGAAPGGGTADGTADGTVGDVVAAWLPTHGIDAAGEAQRRVKRSLFAPRATATPARPMRPLLNARTLATASGQVGYLRLYSFNTPAVRPFLDEAAALLAGLPADRLVVDVRANPGGNILAAEGLLQLLVAGRDVEPARFSLATTAAVADLCQADPSLAPWAASAAAGVETGERYTTTSPLSAPRALAGQRFRYPGRVVLVTDALAYSAADIFAAGFADNRLGVVLGTDPATGAGGANVWTHDLLRSLLPDALRPLPASAGLRVALRRATRADGSPLEDLGVVPDAVHRPTRRDLRDNGDLFDAAAALLG